MEELIDKFRGVIVGGALGDALGKAVEDVPVDEVVKFYGGKIRGFVEPHPMSPSVGQRPEETSDETTISVLLAQSIIERKGIDPFHFFEKLREWAQKEETHRYPDPTLLTAIDLISSGTGLDEAGLVSFSVEGILRCTITGLFHYYNPYIAVEAGRLVSLITHRSKEIYDASALVSAVISYLLLESFDLTDPSQKSEFLENLKGFLKYERHRVYLDTVRQLLEKATGTEEAIERIGNSTFVFEALPLALYIFLRHSDNPEEALWEAVNACGRAGGDTDAIGYLVGSFVGAYSGVWAFPSELLEKLENYEYYILLADRLFETTLEFLERRS